MRTSLLNPKIYYVLILVIGILLIGFGSAEVQHLGVFKQNDCIKLIQICGNCTYNNITSIMLPNSTSITTQVAMTKVLTEYNYTYCSTSQLGTYIVNGFGNENGIVSVWSYDFNITSTGNDKDLYLPLILGITAMIFLISGIFIKNAFLGLFSAFLFIILGIYSMIYGFGVIQDQYTQMISYVIIGIGVVVGFASVYEMYGEGED